MTAQKLAYSYQRFSSGKQGTGTSLERQQQYAENLCLKNNWHLTEPLIDRGVSGWKGKNQAVGNLGKFLKAIEQGTIKKGSVLIVENLDRLSRDDVIPALNLVVGILKADIDIQTANPERYYTKKDINNLPVLMEFLISSCLANEESNKKSFRSKNNWQYKREKLSNHNCPSWLKWDGKKYVADADKVKIIRQIFRLCCDGYGNTLIAKKLNADAVPTFTNNREKGAQIWNIGQVRDILVNKAVMGTMEFRAEEKVIKSIPAYYPAVVKEDIFYKAQNSIENRKVARGKQGTNGKVSNLFTGLLFTTDGKPLSVIHQGTYLTCPTGNVGAGERVSFNYTTFEKSFLANFGNLPINDFNPDKEENRVETLNSKLNAIERQIDTLNKRIIEKGEDITQEILNLLEHFGKQKKQVEAEIEQEKAKATHNGKSSMEELKKQLLLIASMPKEDIRRKLKGIIRSLINNVVVDIEKLGVRDKIAHCHISFKNGTEKTFDISSKPIITEFDKAEQFLKKK